MSDLVPAENAPAPTMLAPLNTSGGTPLERIKGLAGQPAVKRMLPWFLGAAAIGGVALTWSIIAPSPQRVLYAQLGDRMAGSEAQCRHAALLLKLCREQEARPLLLEVERRAKRLDRFQRAREADMYDWAARTLAEIRS